jgi:hypothetical protein
VMHAPTVIAGGQMGVGNGPIVCRDKNTWTLDPLSDANHSPRKFSAGGIQQRSEPPSIKPSTDQKEYWAYTSPGFAAVIDTATYAAQAKATPIPLVREPQCASGGLLVSSPTAGFAYFDTANCVTAGDTAVFDGPPGAPYTFSCPTPPCAIYVKGNARFVHTNIDMSTGAVIVDGNVQLGANGVNGNPWTYGAYCAPDDCVDYPYNGGLNLHDWCESHGLGCLDVQRTTGIRGFLYAMKNLSTDPNIFYYWTVEGAVRVDGILNVQNGVFLVNYNDIVNHNIRTTNFELQIDSMTAVP